MRFSNTFHGLFYLSRAVSDAKLKDFHLNTTNVGKLDSMSSSNLVKMGKTHPHRVVTKVETDQFCKYELAQTCNDPKAQIFPSCVAR